MTAASSSSSEAAARPPVIELRDVGLWFRLQHRATRSLRELLTGREPQAAVKTKWALRGVNLTCREGESWGIVGHNGAGKSTLCLVLANILTPDEGAAKVRGKVSALVTLGAGISPELTGRENVLLYASFLGIPRETILANMGEIADFSELSPRGVNVLARSGEAGPASPCRHTVTHTLTAHLQQQFIEPTHIGGRIFQCRPLRQHGLVKKYLGQIRKARLVLLVLQPLD